MAPRLGLERFRLGMEPRCLGMGRLAGRRLVRRRLRSSPYYRAAADLCCTAADHCRPSCNSPAAPRGSPTAAGGCSARGSGPAAAIDRRAARRGIAPADCGFAAACRRCCSGASPRHPDAAGLRALYRSSRPGLGDDRACLVARRLRHRRLRSLRIDCGNITFRPSGVRRRSCRLSWSTVRSIPLGLGRGPARVSPRTATGRSRSALAGLPPRPASLPGCQQSSPTPIMVIRTTG